MSALPFAPIPHATIRLGLGPEEWEACLDAWLALTDLNLRLPQHDFTRAIASDGSLISFLKSYYYEAARAETGDATLWTSSKSQQLRKACFLLVHRICLQTDSASSLLDWEFCRGLSLVHKKNAALSRLLSNLWTRQDEPLQKILQKQKGQLIKSLESSATDAEEDLLHLATVIRASADAAALCITGSDFLDALLSAFAKHSSSGERKAIALTTYLGLTALTKIEPPNVSLLSDHLYTLKSSADQKSNQPCLLAELVTNTPFITKLRRTVTGKKTDRLLKLLDELDTYRAPAIAKPKRLVHRTKYNGAGKAAQVNGELHVHHMSLITQVQDLFPDLGSGFVLRLLNEYDDDVEKITAHLLDDSLPLHLRDLDRRDNASMFDTDTQTLVDNLGPRSTPPAHEDFLPERRNVFDGDELDRLEVDTARLHIGKKKGVQIEGQPNKAAILSSLAAFDSDDDERDDTYDVEDVGGTVDTAHPDGEPSLVGKAMHDENDLALFAIYKSSPELFGRTFDIRKGQARRALKDETGMTDEAIEGWAIMLQRDPRRLKRLESQSEAFDGRQTELARTSYRESPGATETEDSDAPGGSSRGNFRGRGQDRRRGGRGGGRGGGVAGPFSDPGTAAAQKRKEASKGSRANHNRRDQRAKKMARGGFAV